MIKTPLSLKDLPSVRQLRAFVAVYQTGNLSAAAELLAITQPAVTVLLRDLETKLGIRLFDRSTRRLRRTEAAAEAIGFAERALAELAAMGSAMADFAGTRRGRLRVAATSAVAQSLLPQALARFRQLHPEIRVSIDDCAPSEFVERVLGDHVDFGIGTLEGPVPGLRERVFLRDALVALATPDHFPANDRSLSWKQLSSLPVITVNAGYDMRRRLDQAASEAGVQLHLEHEVSLLGTALALAANGLGVAVVPGTVLPRPLPAVLARRALVRPVVERRMAVIHKQDRSPSPAAEAFVDMLTKPGPG